MLADTQHAQVIAFCRELVRAESMAGREAAAAEVAERWMRQLGYDEVWVDGYGSVVGRINGQFARPGGWVPVWYEYRNLSRLELLAYYRAADIALITPLKDGMNLVAKEYCACSIEEDCVLILSEFAGAAAQLACGALLVNPYDIRGVADAIRVAHAMSAEERTARMRRMRPCCSSGVIVSACSSASAIMPAS